MRQKRQRRDLVCGLPHVLALERQPGRIARRVQPEADGGIADRAEGTFGGVYTFESEQAVDDYLQSDLFAAVGSTPGLVNISVRRFGILDGPTRVTRGFAQPAGV